MERLRPHPEDRLASPVQVVDLAAAAAELRAELHAPVAGHRQIAVVRHGPVTIIQFVFDEGGLLKQHRADGVVTIHVLEGRLQVIVDDDAREVGRDELDGAGTWRDALGAGPRPVRHAAHRAPRAGRPGSRLNHQVTPARGSIKIP